MFSTQQKNWTKSILEDRNLKLENKNVLEIPILETVFLNKLSIKGENIRN